MTKTHTRRGWGLVLRTNKGLAVTEVVIGKRKPRYDEFFDGEIRSRIIPVKVVYTLTEPRMKRHDYSPRTIHS